MPNFLCDSSMPVYALLEGSAHDWQLEFLESAQAMLVRTGSHGIAFHVSRCLFQPFGHVSMRAFGYGSCYFLDTASCVEHKTFHKRVA